MSKEHDTENHLTRAGSPASDCSRFLIYRPGKRDYLCVVMARDHAHALKVARQVFEIPRGTRAVKQDLGRVMQQAKSSEEFRAGKFNSENAIAQTPPDSGTKDHE